MPWIQFLLLLAVVYVVVLVVRGIIQFVPWFLETFVEPRQLARPKKNPPPRPDGTGRASFWSRAGSKAAWRSVTSKRSLSPPSAPPPA